MLLSYNAKDVKIKWSYKAKLSYKAKDVTIKLSYQANHVAKL